jgi:UDP-2-acetamido-3-amino-2,3-dideoxy-glucuronate N-acetyltransferase
MINQSPINCLASVETKYIGKNTKIWQYVVVLPGARIGDDCNICSHCFIENDVVIGNRVTIKNGVQLWDGLRVEDDVFIGPNSSFGNDLFPRSRVKRIENLQTLVEAGASIGSGCVILPGVRIGRKAMIAAGSVVTRTVPPFAIVRGNPARIVGYVDADRTQANPRGNKGSSSNLIRVISKVPEVTQVELHRVSDMRGSLVVGEVLEYIPFAIKRIFMIYNVPSIETRGEHAHKKCHQFLICTHGSCSVVVDNGEARQEFILDRPDIGLHIPPKVWGIQYKYSPDAVLLVLASENYDPLDYIRDYNEFLAIKSIK